MTTKAHERADLRALRRKLDALRVDDATQGLFVQAMESFLTAADYPDEVLMRSALEEAKTAVGVDITAAVEDLVARSLSSQVLLREVTDVLEGVPIEPDEQFDELGRALSLPVSTALRGMRNLRDGLVAMVRKHGVDVPNAAKLDEHIAYWEAVKTNLVDCWPWTDAPLPPADREMIARSRAAIKAGEQGESLEAVIERRRSK